MLGNDFCAKLANNGKNLHAVIDESYSTYSFKNYQHLLCNKDGPKGIEHGGTQILQ